MRKAVYAGSFDPPTNGHLWMINEGSELFDELVVAIGTNLGKKYAFSLDERIEMLKDISKSKNNIKIDQFENLYVVNYAKSINAQYILRGIRNENDYSYENAMRHINNDLCNEIKTIFLIPPRELTEISSSMVKGLIGFEGWREAIKQYVPECVYKKLLEKNGN